MLWSTHDIVILTIFQNLGMSSPECIKDKYLNGVNNTICLDFPAYASNLILELHK